MQQAQKKIDVKRDPVFFFLFLWWSEGIFEGFFFSLSQNLLFYTLKAYWIKKWSAGELQLLHLLMHAVPCLLLWMWGKWKSNRGYSRLLSLLRLLSLCAHGRFAFKSFRGTQAEEESLHVLGYKMISSLNGRGSRIQQFSMYYNGITLFFFLTLTCLKIGSNNI